MIFLFKVGRSLRKGQNILWLFFCLIFLLSLYSIENNALYVSKEIKRCTNKFRSIGIHHLNFTQDSLYFLKCTLFRTHRPGGVGSSQAVNSNDETTRVTGQDLQERSKCASESHTPA